VVYSAMTCQTLQASVDISESIELFFVSLPMLWLNKHLRRLGESTITPCWLLYCWLCQSQSVLLWD